jgi:hypothetical protein
VFLQVAGWLSTLPPQPTSRGTGETTPGIGRKAQSWRAFAIWWTVSRLPEFAKSEANLPKVSGRHPECSRFREADAGDWVRSPLRDQCLNEHLFANLNEARQIIEEWRIDYNTNRPGARGSHRPSLQLAPTGTKPGAGSTHKRGQIESRSRSIATACSTPNNLSTVFSFERRYRSTKLSYRTP